MEHLYEKLFLETPVATALWRAVQKPNLEFVLTKMNPACSPYFKQQPPVILIGKTLQQSIECDLPKLNELRDRFEEALRTQKSLEVETIPLPTSPNTKEQPERGSGERGFSLSRRNSFADMMETSGSSLNKLTQQLAEAKKKTDEVSNMLKINIKPLGSELLLTTFQPTTIPADHQKAKILMERSSDIVLSFTQHGAITYINQKGREKLQTEVGSSVLDYCGELVSEKILSALIMTGNWEGELRLSVSGGELIGQVQIILDEHQVEPTFSCIIRDISHWKHSIKLLSRMAELVEVYPDFIELATTDGITFYHNRTACKMVGLNQHQISGTHISSFHPLWATDIILNQAIPMATKDGFWRGEVSLRTQSKSEMAVNMLLLAHRSSDGAVEFFSAVMRDISDLKKASQEFDILKQALDRAPQRVVILENRTTPTQIYTTVHVNKTFTSMTGYDTHDLIGADLSPLLGSDHLKLVQTHNTTHRTSIRLKRKDQSELDVCMTIHPLVNQHGQHVNHLLYFADVADSWSLQHRIRELEKAKSGAEQSSKNKSVYLSNMSHEIRTPLNGIIGMTSLLGDTNLTVEQEEFVHNIRTLGDTLLEIISDILDYEKFQDPEQIEFENIPFDLRDCVESAFDMISVAAGSKGIELVYSIDENTPEIFKGDITRVRQILSNLLSNAIKFSPERRGEIFMRVESRCVVVNDSSSSSSASRLEQKSAQREEVFEVHFICQDNGIGIPADSIIRLFQRFAQADNSTSRKFGGTGLGLAISKMLANMMSGSLWAESEGYNKGATFHAVIKLPACPSPEKIFFSPCTLASKSILIVIGNLRSQSVFEYWMKKWKMIHRFAKNEEEALTILKQRSFDVVVMEHNVNNDGKRLAKHIYQLFQEGVHVTNPLYSVLLETDTMSAGPQSMRQSSESSNYAFLQLPLIVCGNIFQTNDNEFLQLFRARLTKPVKPALLHRALSDLLGVAHSPKKSDKIALRRHSFSVEYPLRILIAEDNPVNQKVALQTLHKLGYRADIAANGVEVLKLLTNHRYDIILMDIQMPIMDGLECTQQIRKQMKDVSRKDQPYIIAVTANVFDSDQKECFDSGMDAFISKPFKRDELEKSLKVAFQKLSLH
eukprot:TRINITY_DN2215_c0_g1_i1.p1 TRINITY_DN2215_c0_g1~~TRINITY_DN2215_c0_g1_i1.p1  ORF type:complete len:1116 (-),score=232.99 TRINITY_DN2215_c0_g1_i1:151-3498(-)